MDYSYLLNQKFHKLTIVDVYPPCNGPRKCLVKCECGTIKILEVNKVTTKNKTQTKSCGCYRNGPTIEGVLLKFHPAYRVWSGIKTRCYNPKDSHYHRYGGRGIKMCEQWFNSSEAFVTWAIQNGYKKGLEIDREDNDGDYEPSNCRFVTRAANQRNKSANTYLEYNGERKTMVEWAEIFKISHSTIHYRLKRNWSVAQSLETPILQKFIPLTCR